MQRTLNEYIDLIDGKYILAILTLTLLWCIYWHVRDNVQLPRQWGKMADRNRSQWLIRFAWSRSIQLFAGLACCIIIILMYDWQLSKARQQIQSLQKQIATTANNATATSNVPVIKNPALKPAESADVAPAITSADVTATSPETTIVSPNQAIADIYNPIEVNSIQAALDNIKKRYEDMLINYFFLKKCNRINSSDYHIIISALSQEMASVNAPGRLQNDILVAAQGSYKEMYEQSDCNSPDTDTLYNQYSSYIKTVSEQYTAH